MEFHFQNTSLFFVKRYLISFNLNLAQLVSATNLISPKKLKTAVCVDTYLSMYALVGVLKNIKIKITRKFPIL